MSDATSSYSLDKAPKVVKLCFVEGDNTLPSCHRFRSVNIVGELSMSSPTIFIYQSPRASGELKEMIKEDSLKKVALLGEE